MRPLALPVPPRLFAAVVAAVAVPLLWSAWNDWPSIGGLGSATVATRLVALSMVYWGCVGVLLLQGRCRRPLMNALVLGLLSPLVCSVLCIVAGVVLLPIEMMGGHLDTLMLGCAGPVAWVAAPLLFFPVGVAMGALVWGLTRVGGGGTVLGDR
jgi:hypothetical protein